MPCGAPGVIAETSLGHPKHTTWYVYNLQEDASVSVEPSEILRVETVQPLEGGTLLAISDADHQPRD